MGVTPPTALVGVTFTIPDMVPPPALVEENVGKTVTGEQAMLAVMLHESLSP